ncbi:MAG TPA: TonB-dependent receptor plug domain-containing protein, partial [Longimicrobiales bacterium]|nr:TonB-dependent receptor plug domain-containing protein [Longimicrobiales bacterium]
GGDGAPLIFVDGERCDMAELREALESLDADAVSSIEVIKGAAAAELYGAEAANGVIHVNLKHD